MHTNGREIIPPIFASIHIRVHPFVLAASFVHPPFKVRIRVYSQLVAPKQSGRRIHSRLIFVLLWCPIRGPSLRPDKEFAFSTPAAVAS
jgi:hypothetical protein